jgi:hypothetical protein
MDSKKFVIATLVGTVVNFMLGGLIYAVLLAGFFAEHMGMVPGAARTEPLMWAIAVSELAGAAMLTLLIGVRGKGSSPADGLQVGAAVGFIMTVFFDFNLFGTTNIADMTAIVADLGLATARFAITGAVVGAVVGRK